jgi:hypothetical protein
MDCLAYLDEHHIKFLYNLLIKIDSLYHFQTLYSNKFNRSKIINIIVHILRQKNIDIKELLNDYNIHIYDINYYYKLYDEINMKLHTIQELNCECNICFNNYNCKNFWKCDHYICNTCYKSWNTSCPLCRNENKRKEKLKINSIVIIIYKGYNNGYYMKIKTHLYNGFIFEYIKKYISIDYIKENMLEHYIIDNDINNKFNEIFLEYEEIINLINNGNFIIY